MRKSKKSTSSNIVLVAQGVSSSEVTPIASALSAVLSPAITEANKNTLDELRDEIRQLQDLMKFFNEAVGENPVPEVSEWIALLNGSLPEQLWAALKSTDGSTLNNPDNFTDFDASVAAIRDYLDRVIYPKGEVAVLAKLMDFQEIFNSREPLYHVDIPWDESALSTNTGIPLAQLKTIIDFFKDTTLLPINLEQLRDNLNVHFPIEDWEVNSVIQLMNHINKRVKAVKERSWFSSFFYHSPRAALRGIVSPSTEDHAESETTIIPTVTPREKLEDIKKKYLSGLTTDLQLNINSELDRLLKQDTPDGLAPCMEKLWQALNDTNDIPAMNLLNSPAISARLERVAAVVTLRAIYQELKQNTKKWFSDLTSDAVDDLWITVEPLNGQPVDDAVRQYITAPSNADLIQLFKDATNIENPEVSESVDVYKETTKTFYDHIKTKLFKQFIIDTHKRYVNLFDRKDTSTFPLINSPDLPAGLVELLSRFPNAPTDDDLEQLEQPADLQTLQRIFKALTVEMDKLEKIIEESEADDRILQINELQKNIPADIRAQIGPLSTLPLADPITAAILALVKGPLLERRGATKTAEDLERISPTALSLITPAQFKDGIGRVTPHVVSFVKNAKVTLIKELQAKIPDPEIRAKVKDIMGDKNPFVVNFSRFPANEMILNLIKTDPPFVNFADLASDLQTMSMADFVNVINEVRLYIEQAAENIRIANDRITKIKALQQRFPGKTIDEITDNISPRVTKDRFNKLRVIFNLPIAINDVDSIIHLVTDELDPHFEPESERVSDTILIEILHEFENILGTPDPLSSPDGRSRSSSASSSPDADLSPLSVSRGYLGGPTSNQRLLAVKTVNNDIVAIDNNIKVEELNDHIIQTCQNIPTNIRRFEQVKSLREQVQALKGIVDYGARFAVPFDDEITALKSTLNAGQILKDAIARLLIHIQADDPPVDLVNELKMPKLSQEDYQNALKLVTNRVNALISLPAVARDENVDAINKARAMAINSIIARRKNANLPTQFKSPFVVPTGNKFVPGIGDLTPDAFKAANIIMLPLESGVDVTVTTLPAELKFPTTAAPAGLSQKNYEDGMKLVLQRLAQDEVDNFDTAMSIWAQRFLKQISGNQSNELFPVTSIPNVSEATMGCVFAYVNDSLKAYYSEYQSVINEEIELNKNRPFQDPYAVAESKKNDSNTQLGKLFKILQAQTQDLNHGAAGRVELVTIFYEKGSERIAALAQAKVHTVIPLSPFESLAELIFACSPLDIREGRINSPKGLFGKKDFAVTLREATPGVNAIKIVFKGTPQDIAIAFSEFVKQCEDAKTPGQPPITLKEEAKALDIIFYKILKQQVMLYKEFLKPELKPTNKMQDNRRNTANALETIWKIVDQWLALGAILPEDERAEMKHLMELFNRDHATIRSPYSSSLQMHSIMLATTNDKLKDLFGTVPPDAGRLCSTDLPAMHREHNRMRPILV